jgi:hypothetical protein
LKRISSDHKSQLVGTNEGQILQFFQTCLDEGTALQLKREIEANPRITVAQFLKIMENDFSKDFSAQSCDEWRAVKLTNWGKSLRPKNGELSSSNLRLQRIES